MKETVLRDVARAVCRSYGYLMYSYVTFYRKQTGVARDGLGARLRELGREPNPNPNPMHELEH
jgi:hypothetical protein